MKTNMWLVLILLSSSVGFAAEYRKAVETKDNVKNKRYPKKGKIELNINGGGIINQSFTDTFSIHGSLNYFFSEAWGLGIDVMKNFNSDRGERACIENFMLRATNVVISPECLTAEEGISQDGSLAKAQEIQQSAAANNVGVLNADRITAGPAYVPIREKEMTIGLNLVWNPVYGKQLFFGIGWFDLFVNMGVGVAFNNYYPQKDSYVDPRNGNTVLYRGPYSDDPNDPVPGVDVRTLDPNSQADRDYFGSLVGTGGRPQVVEEVGGYILLGIGQRYHFAKFFHVNIELRNYTHLGVEGFFDNYFTLMGGLGFRI